MEGRLQHVAPHAVGKADTCHDVDQDGNDHRQHPTLRNMDDTERCFRIEVIHHKAPSSTYKNGCCNDCTSSKGALAVVDLHDIANICQKTKIDGVEKAFRNKQAILTPILKDSSQVVPKTVPIFLWRTFWNCRTGEN